MPLINVSPAAGIRAVCTSGDLLLMSKAIDPAHVRFLQLSYPCFTIEIIATGLVHQSLLWFYGEGTGRLLRSNV